MAACCFFTADVISMHLPTMIFSENDGPLLREYHEQYYVVNRNTKGSHYFMPKSENELTALYEEYKAGKVISRVVSPIKSLWWPIARNIKDEFHYRCLDGNKSLINEYLSCFCSFIEITDNFQDQSFLSVLCSPSVGGLCDGLQLFIINLEREIKETPDLTRESTHLPYTVGEISRILGASRNFREVKLAEFYRRHFLTDEFLNSPEYKAIYETITEVFQSGVSLTDLTSKKESK